MKSLLYRVISFLFPHYCLGCKKHGSVICSKCLATIPAPERDLPRGIYALFDYRDPLIKKALWNLKYGNVPELATVVAPLLYENIIEILAEEYALLEANHIVVVPIPTSGDKTKKRAYNHAYKIAQAVVEYQNKQIVTTPPYGHPSLKKEGKWLLLDPLIKIKKTERQAMVKGRDKRIKNIEGAYAIAPAIASRIVDSAESCRVLSIFARPTRDQKQFLNPKPVDKLGVGPLSYPQPLNHAFFIIIDDIITTGASINEAMRALKPLKPRHMFGITIAH